MVGHGGRSSQPCLGLKMAPPRNTLLNLLGRAQSPSQKPRSPSCCEKVAEGGGGEGHELVGRVVEPLEVMGILLNT